MTVWNLAMVTGYGQQSRNNEERSKLGLVPVMTIPESLSMLTIVLPTTGALLGRAIGAVVTYRISSRTYQIDRLKLISSWTKSEELEKARIAADRELWQCLGGVSTHKADEIVRNLPAVQKRLQEWYYDRGGGVFLAGAAEKGGSTKASFFAARDLQSSDPSEIWTVFH
jgi:hypothetical protein